MNLGELIVTLGVDTTKLKALNAEINNVSNKFNSAGKTMTASLTLPLAAAGVAAFKLQKDFESSLSKVVGLVGVAQEQVDKWGQDILKLAPQIGRAPSELADALFFVTSAGIRGAEAMDVLTISAKASASGLGETKIVADLVTSAMNAYGSANLDASKATDILVSAVKEGKAEAPALAASLGQVLPIASEMGVTFDQVGAAVAAMTRTGTDAATASTQLKSILNSLLKPTSEAGDALNAMGTSAAEMRDVIKNQGLFAALTQLKTLQKKYGDETLSTVFPNIRALSGVLDLMGSNASETAKIFNSLGTSTGALDNAFLAASETAEFKLNQAIASGKASLTELGAEVSKAFVPVLEKMTEVLGNVTEWFGMLDDSQKRFVVTLGAFTAAAGPALIVFSKMIKLIPALTSPLGAVAVGIGLVVTAIAAVRLRANQTQQAIESVNETANKSIVTQKVKVEQLLRVAKDENRSLKERKSALQELNRISPEYFGNLNIETVNTESATKAKEAYIKELLREAKVKAITNKLTELEEKATTELVDGQAKELNFLQKTLTAAVLQYGGFAKAAEFAAETSEKNFNEVTASIEKTRNALQDLLDETLTASDIPDLGGDSTTNITANVDSSGAANASSQFGEMQKILKNVGDEIGYINQLNIVLGNSFDDVAAKADVYTQALNDLVRLGFQDGDASIQQMKSSLMEVNLEQEFLNKLGEDAISDQEEINNLRLQGAVINEDFAASMNGIAEAESLAAEQASRMNLITQTVSSSLAQMASVLGSTVAEGKKGFIDLANVALDAISRIVNALLAEAIAKMIAKESSKGLLGLATAAIGIAALKGLFNKHTKAAKMEQGGIVPSGYPNDTYPALLTSGERVTPPNKLPENNMKLVAKIEGQDLLFMVEDAKRISETNF